MEVKPYSDTAGKKEQVERMFDAISKRYDFLNRSLSFGIDVYWRKKMVAKLRKDQPASILDIATGTADVAISLRKLNPEKIIGLDLSEKMLEVGREKISKRKLSGLIQLVKGDSEQLPYADNTFDAVTVAFGVRNFENLLRGLQEMHRVVKPGGKVVILEFSRPYAFPVKQLYEFYFKHFCPWWGKLVSKDNAAYTYLYDSVKAFPEGDDFLRIAKEAGYIDGKAERLTFGIVSLYTVLK
ncbi:MAG: bifunctional demethylmenaquinone methyltransferase/2-methoxy-6-polyprenyl-1,4-benzoquinol methylase UbiE [Bacteroidia bacterium]